MRLTAWIFTGICALGLVACGGGGGGGFIGAANVNLNVSPTYIDTGDRVEVRAYLTDVHENGLELKFRYPSGLEYVRDSSFLKVDGEDIDIGPTVNQTSSTTTYLVFYLSQAIFGEGIQGEIRFQLEGTAEVIDGEVAVDPDIDDPDTDNDSEFAIRNPNFGAEDSVYVDVVD